MRVLNILAAALLFAGHAAGQTTATKQPSLSIVGYVRDAGCVYRFHDIVKPLPNGCVESCVRAGSPLVILTKDGRVYQPISTDIPDYNVQAKLLPYAGQLVKVTGHLYERGGASAISIEKIQPIKE
jgi:hypothetical protein